MTGFSASHDLSSAVRPMSEPAVRDSIIPTRTDSGMSSSAFCRMEPKRGWSLLYPMARSYSCPVGPAL